MLDPGRAAIHDAEAARRFPGPDYYEVLEWIHAALRPAVYLEIGVLYGESLKLAQPPTHAIGVDPEPRADHPWRTRTEVHAMTSSEYFAGGEAPAVSLALIDGEHGFRAALRDFRNIERRLAPGGVILIHDTIPLDEETSGAVRTTEFYTGDVWRMLAYLALCRPALDAVTVLAAPSGLTMVRGCDAEYEDDPRELDAIEGLPWMAYAEYLHAMPNSKAAVQGWLLRQ